MDMQICEKTWLSLGDLAMRVNVFSFHPFLRRHFHLLPDPSRSNGTVFLIPWTFPVAAHNANRSAMNPAVLLLWNRTRFDTKLACVSPVKEHKMLREASE